MAVEKAEEEHISTPSCSWIEQNRKRNRGGNNREGEEEEEELMEEQ